MTQRDLFDRFTEPLRASEPRESRVPAEDRERTDTQRAAILERLRRGPVRNTELNQIAFRYSARIYELRKAGHDIDVQSLGGGVNVYRLKD